MENAGRPRVLILGGGVLSASELLHAEVRSALMAQSTSRGNNMLEIVPSRLGADAALIGAVVSFL